MSTGYTENAIFGYTSNFAFRKYIVAKSRSEIYAVIEKLAEKWKNETVHYHELNPGHSTYKLLSFMEGDVAHAVEA